MRFKIPSKYIVLLLFAGFSLACLWDNDTIEMERQQFPGILELMSGKFLRHSPEFYYWRLKDREEKLSNGQSSAEIYDDLAVAYAKLGYLDKAIALMQTKETKYPGLYETQANLGTFYLHNQQFNTGLEHIKKAIQINPDAHFGREKYQAYLAEYIIAKMQDNKIPFPLGLTQLSPNAENRQPNYYFFIANKINTEKPFLTEEQLNEAIEGISGMMKFGNFESPILLEALGDLLMNETYESDNAARFLAARAYIKASMAFTDKNIIEQYSLLAENALSFVEKNISIKSLIIMLNNEVEQGENFYNEIANNELEWIISGKNPETEFAKTYYNEENIQVVIDERLAYTNEATEFNSIDWKNLKATFVALEKEPLRMVDPMVEAYLDNIMPSTTNSDELPTAAKEFVVPNINNRNPVPLGVILTALGIFGLIIFLIKYFKVL